VFEKRHQMSSTEFAASTNLNSNISEDDAMDWHFLIMQKQSLEEDGCVDGINGNAEVRNVCTFSRFKSTVAAQEPHIIYDKVAA